MTTAATTTDFVIAPLRPIWVWLGLLLNAVTAACALFLCWVLEIRPDAAGFIVLALLLSVTAWTSFNAIMIFGLALKRRSVFRILIRPGRLACESARGNLILSPADIERYICYNNKIVFRRGSGNAAPFPPFLRVRPDETTLYTTLLSGGGAEIRRQLMTFDPDFDSKQGYSFGSILGWFAS